MQLVYANSTGSITNDHGVTFNLKAGEAWDADDPLVKQRPRFFSPEPVLVMTSAHGLVRVEQATAAPGEKRTKR